MEVKEATNANWIHHPTLPSAINNPLGWKPVQLVPENALSGKGGYPLMTNPLQNQSIWFEVYIQKDLVAGIYFGNVVIETSEGDYTIPVRLEVLDFSLPDENSLNTMFYFENFGPLLYMGEAVDYEPRFHRFAHRHRVEFTHAYDIRSASSNLGRFNGHDFVPENGYAGPGKNVGNKIVPRTFYNTPDEWLNQSTARSLSDEWMEFINDNIPDAITFLLCQMNQTHRNSRLSDLLLTISIRIRAPGKILKYWLHMNILLILTDISISGPQFLHNSIKKELKLKKTKGSRCGFTTAAGLMLVLSLMMHLLPIHE